MLRGGLSWASRGVLVGALVALPCAARSSDGGAAASQPTSQPSSAPTSQPASAPAADGGAATDLRADTLKPEWTPTLSATVKPVVVAVGDPIDVQVRVRHRKGVSVTLPLRLELGEFTELSRSESAREIKTAGQLPDEERTFVIKVAAYRLGTRTLPPIEIAVLGPVGQLVTLRTTSFPIRVRSVMANEPNPQLKGLEPPVSVLQRNLWLIYGLIGLASAALIVGTTLVVARALRARKKAALPPPPPVPAHVLALGRLGALDVAGHVAAERFKELYLALSEIIREYVGGRWGFDALEMTTSEIREALTAHRVANEVRARVVTFFNDCDLVKFAKYKPDPEAASEAAREAEALVRSTMPLVEIPAAVASAADGAAPSRNGHG